MKSIIAYIGAGFALGVAVTLLGAALLRDTDVPIEERRRSASTLPKGASLLSGPTVAEGEPTESLAAATIPDHITQPEARRFWYYEEGKRKYRGGVPVEKATAGLIHRDDELALLKGFFEAWAKQEPTAAAAYLQANKGTEETTRMLSLVLDTWGRADGRAAMEWTRKHLSVDEQAYYTKKVSEAWALAAPESSAQWLAAQPDDPVARANLATTARIWAENDPIQAERWLTTRLDQPAVAAAVPLALQGMAEHSPDYAWQALDRATYAFTGTTVDQVSLEDLLTRAGGATSGLVAATGRIFQIWGAQSRDTSWIAANKIRPQNLRHAALQGLATTWSAQDPVSALGHLSRAPVRDAAVRDALVTAANPLVRNKRPFSSVLRDIRAASANDNHRANCILTAITSAAYRNQDVALAAMATAQITDPKMAAEAAAESARTTD